MHEHGKTYCRECNILISQCRCMGPHKVMYDVCEQCKKSKNDKK